MNQKTVEGTCLPCKGTETRDWYAWNNLQQPTPNYFHITGEVYVPNPGVDPFLTPTVPQGFDPDTLLLDLYLCQRPGNWTGQLVWKPVRFDKKIDKGYARVQIMCEGNILAVIDKVDDVH